MSEISSVRYGDLVRAKCGATGRSMGRGLVLFVSAQDNDWAIDWVDPDREPQPELPKPTDRELAAAAAGYEAAVYHHRRFWQR